LLSLSAEDTNSVLASTDLSARVLTTRWGEAANAHVMAQWRQSFTNPIPLSGEGQLRIFGARTTWGDATDFQTDATLGGSTNSPMKADPSWGWWTTLADRTLSWQGHLVGLQSPTLKTEEVSCNGTWNAPELRATRFAAHLYGGQVEATGQLNIASR